MRFPVLNSALRFLYCPRMAALAQNRLWCVLVPAYQEAGRIGRTVAAIREHCDKVIVIDDGSGDRTAEEAGAAGAQVIRHPRNLGKGAALHTGFEHALQQNYEFLITMDGDGQHDPADIPAFIAAFDRTQAPVVVGNRMDDPATMPLVRRCTNRYMSWLLSRRMGQRVPDTQNGFRLYARAAFPLLVATVCTGFAAESEVLLKLAGSGLRIASAPVKIIYRDEKSKIRPVRDTIRFFRMLHANRGG
jgi:glycosyltransferase involved in cell wall biosynthesis